MGAGSAAVQAKEGRGPSTSLEVAVPAHFELGTPSEVGIALHTGAVPHRRVLELPPAVFAPAADGDTEAAAILDRLAEEVVAFARAAIVRLGLEGETLD